MLQEEEEKRAVLMLIYLYAIIDTILFMLLQVLLVVTLGPFIIQLTCWYMYTHWCGLILQAVINNW